ncbi:hypothetical protein A9P82_04210 [Arachidicoccus ginsenosidimutans]|nr:hypothetical protein A9P82_04210 [Arachidicoccus sp. BS20]
MSFAACSKSDVTDNSKPTDPAADYSKMASYVLSGTSIRVDVYRQYDSLFVGYNPLYFKLTDTASGQLVNNASLMLNPTMNMGAMMHGCPIDQPEYIDSLRLYKAGISFLMSSDAAMDMNESMDMSVGWTLPTNISLNGNTYKDTLPVTVKDMGVGKEFIQSTLGSDGNTYYLVLVHPWQKEQAVGMNDLEVAVYRKDGMFDFPAVDGLTLSFVPTMPSMGHSSPNNIAPVSIGNGHYKGKVNFTMTGDWQLDFTIKNGSNTLANGVDIDLFF